MAELLHVTPVGTRSAKVTLEHRVQTTSGFPVETWETFATLWMQKVDLLGTEAYRANQTAARYDVRFIGPYAPTLDPETVDVAATHRLRHRGQVYDITSAAIVGHYEGIEYFAMTSTQTEGL